MNMGVTIETDELILRELTMDDLQALHLILSDQETMQYYPAPFELNKTRNWINWNIENYSRYGFGLWAVIIKETGQFIGDCGITMQMILDNSVPEIGYHIDKRFWNKGYATQASKACLRYAFDVAKFDKVYSYQKYTNIPSRRVAEKMGMTLTQEYADDINTKTSVYAINKTEYYLID